ncbi:hypothetical protein GA0061099_10478 [Bradyrhizobium yuanmingense]|uniref:Uncharacterized protein n=1 Tax=Bradyrhizobium yuanmingense TaxID=108015 RepID=A0A1C3XLA7_9BRAD|nr:hypothetical protein [Bradyrhizobium yuanmingense]TWI16825.1 hypothetical protein IQ15_07600 [Bradyrhizobium yuanmingense]SCB53043.1 hypothetical protein GA0061099_10478 [Bradyrhizobium yuanmingense]
MTSWTIERMIDCRARRREVFVGHRISADGGKSWIEEGELHASFADSFSRLTREVDLEEYQSRVAALRAISLIMPFLAAIKGPLHRRVPMVSLSATCATRGRKKT